MDCTDLAAILSGFVDDELDPARRHEAERHLVGCGRCRAMVARAEELDLSLRRAAGAWGREGPLPPQVREGVLARTVRPATAHRLRLAAFGGWIAAAAMLAIAATAWWPGSAAPAPSDGADDAVREVSRDLAVPAPRGDDLLMQGAPFHGPPAALAYAPALDDPALMPLDDDAAPRAEDGDALFAASLVLARIVEGDGWDEAEAERIRGMLQYDALPARLAEARRRLPLCERAAVWCAEAMLVNFASRRLDTEEFSALREDIRRLGLHRRLEAASRRIATQPHA